MTPDRQSELLVRWLQQEPGSPPPSELDPDAVEAVYALRPDLAPAPSLTIDQVLAEVAEGPFARVDAAAVAALVDWLQAHPGQRPSPGVEPEVVEAVYALRPDLAPAPTLSLDDILGGVTTGPFAAAPRPAAASPTVGASAPPAPHPRAGTTRHRSAPPAPRRLPPWAIPALGAAAVAATALMLVLPGSREVMLAPSPFAAEQVRQEATASKKAEADTDQGAATSAPMPSGAAVRGAAPSADAPTRPAADAEAEMSAAEMPEAEMSEAQAPTDATTVARGGALAERKAEAPPEVGADSPAPPKAAAAPSASEPAGALAMDLDDALAPAEEEMDEAEPQTSSGLASGASSGGEGAARAQAVEARQAEKRKTTSPSRADRSRYGSAELAEAAPAAAPAAVPATGEAPATTTTTAASRAVAQGPAGLAALEQAQMSLDQLRAAAWPLGGFPDPTVGRPDVAAAHAAAAEADARGDTVGFVAALRPLLTHSAPDVALDAAFRIARRQQSTGDLSGALSTIEQGLARGGSGLQRARLLALQGQVHERRGDTERAADAFRQAIDAR